MAIDDDVVVVERRSRCRCSTALNHRPALSGTRVSNRQSKVDLRYSFPARQWFIFAILPLFILSGSARIFFGGLTHEGNDRLPLGNRRFSSHLLWVFMTASAQCSLPEDGAVVLGSWSSENWGDGAL